MRGLATPIIPGARISPVWQALSARTNRRHSVSFDGPVIHQNGTFSEEADTNLPPGFELHGIESIPEADRMSTILDFLRLCWGGGNSLATAVLGAFPVMLALSFWQAMTAKAVGVTLGALMLGPMAVFGPLNGTNNAVSSGAHFGVVGRIVGSFLSLLTAIAFFSISVWSSGDAVVGAAHALFRVPESEKLFALAYGLFAASVLIVCIYGFGMMLFVNKVAVVAELHSFWGRSAGLLGRVRPPFRRLAPGVGVRCILAGVRERMPDLAVQPDILRRLSRRLVPLPAAPYP